MFLSALTFAALLQAAPVAGQKGYLLQQKPFETGQRVDQPRLPFPRKSKSAMGEAERAFPPTRIGQAASPFPKKRIIRSPMTPGCGSEPLQRAAHPEVVQVQPLSKMPQAHGELAVARLVDGCPVAVLIAQRTPAP